MQHLTSTVICVCYDYGLLGYNRAYFCRQVQTFCRNPPPPLLGQDSLVWQSAQSHARRPYCPINYTNFKSHHNITVPSECAHYQLDLYRQINSPLFLLTQLFKVLTRLHSYLGRWPITHCLKVKLFFNILDSLYEDIYVFNCRPQTDRDIYHSEKCLQSKS